ncbi:MAG TPA: alpha-amylase family glycosyl hydrolase [Thermomicrobiales bacterium]|nr:alpha-amylase family glycosyl hydrolase [Thermomicrobiales bacterium]
MAEQDIASNTPDVIFGTLTADEQRLNAIRERLHGLWHGARITPRDPEPGDDVTISVTVGTDLSIKGMVVRFTTDGSMPDASSPALRAQSAGSRWETLVRGYIEEWTARIPAQENDTLVQYRIQALTETGETVWADTDPETGEPGLFAYNVDTAQVPRWLRQAVIYRVIVDHFASGSGTSLNDTHGGTLEGLLSRLDHIADLGATAIWLSPVFPSGGDATDYTAVAPRLGTEADLRAAIDAAHARGIRVLLDLVTNDAPDATADTLIDAARYWLERGVDGFHLDDTNGSSLAFWSRFRRALLEMKPDAVLIGESAGSAETMALYDGRLDGMLDLLLLQQIRAFFALGTISSDAFWRFLSRHLAWMPAGLTLPSLLDHDNMNRFLWIVKGDTRKLKIAALVQCALPHPPVIFYGTEVGLSQRHDLENPDGSRRLEESRMPMIWGASQNRELRSFYRALIHWRKSQTIFATSPMLVHAGDDGLLVFRSGQWFIAVNRSEDEIAIDFARHGEVWLALGTEFDVQLHGSALQLPAMSGAILRASDTYH